MKEHISRLERRSARHSVSAACIIIASIVNLGWPAFFHGLYAMLILFGIGAIALEVESGGGL